MKNYEKLLIVMLVISVITTILTVSVCAESSYTYEGVDIPFYYSTAAYQTLDFTSNGVQFNKISIVTNKPYHEINYYYADGSGKIEVYNSNNGWKEEYRTIYTTKALNNDFDSSYSLLPSTCDGTTCPATDMNYDNICDDCGNAFTFNLRNDTYSYNGYYLPSAIEDESGVIVNLNNYWHETLSKNEGNLVILNGESTDNALLYYFTPDVVFSDGQVVTTGKTEVTLYKPSTNENGYLYWKKTSTDTWNTSGALVASDEHIDWVANAVTDENGYTAINGDLNFQTPLWVEIQGVTEGEMTVQLPKMGGTMKILVVCGVGLMACLVVLSLFGKRSLIFRN